MTVSDLPKINAALNTLAAILLMVGFTFIKRGHKAAHRNCMIGALICSTIFLACYVYYHYSMKKLHGQAQTRWVNRSVK